MNRAEHLAWAKQRALQELERSGIVDALTSMLSDLGKHPEMEGNYRMIEDTITGSHAAAPPQAK